jgi:mannose-6-phosphate isomerase class I
MALGPEPLDISAALRNTEQFLMPAKAGKKNETGYDIYPSFKTSETISRGYDGIAEYIAKKGGDFIFEGYGGVQWQIVKTSLNNILERSGLLINWVDIDNYLKTEPEIDEIIAPYLGEDDPLFGTVYPGVLADFFEMEKLLEIRTGQKDITIVYGCGASLVNWKCPIIFFDVPKNEIQFRSRAGNIKNLGTFLSTESKEQYKRFYFIDWKVFNQRKQELLPKISILIDEQRPDDITWITGQGLRNVLSEMSSNVFRARPWFEPGVWGGQWIKQNIQGINNDVVNYAWSFELIAPENGIVIENAGVRLEVSIDALLYHDHKAILGKAANRFGYKYPIRFDFLDTMDGDNLSLQCHPTVKYTKENFGEDFTQDETYYILDAEAGAEVYLGFQNDIDKDEFKQVLKDSFEDSVPVEVEKFVQVFPAAKHDLFLIPNGTVHCSGKNNLVLEISATPYIFTFKMYDWLRPDLGGNPRTLNIERAFDNLNFERKGEVVKETLLSKPAVKKTGRDWQIINLPTHPVHFYSIDRLEFDTAITDETNGQCLVLCLVEGEAITVKTGNVELTIHFAETFIIPAKAIAYSLTNSGNSQAKVVKAYVKEECCY